MDSFVFLWGRISVSGENMILRRLFSWSKSLWAVASGGSDNGGVLYGVILYKYRLRMLLSENIFVLTGSGRSEPL